MRLPAESRNNPDYELKKLIGDKAVAQAQQASQTIPAAMRSKIETDTKNAVEKAVREPFEQRPIYSGAVIGTGVSAAGLLAWLALRRKVDIAKEEAA